MKALFSDTTRLKPNYPRTGAAWVLGLVFWLLASPMAWAQAPSWQSAYLAGGNAYSHILATATDASGNVYVAGHFSNATITLGNITLTNAVTSGSTVGVSRDAFVAKWSPVSGTFVWAQRAGGTTNNDLATALVVSGSSIYVAATLNGAGFGGGAASGDYIIKFTDTGAVVWAQPAGIAIAAVAVSGTSVYLAGSVEGTVSLGNLSLTSAGGSDLAVAKLTDAGSTSTFVWAQRAGGVSYEYVKDLVVSGTSLYVATFYGANSSFGATQLVAAGSGVAKLTDAGNAATLNWIQPNTVATFTQLAAGSNGRLYVTGSFVGTASFGATSFTNAGYSGSFLACLTDAGNSAGYEWAQQLVDATGYTTIYDIVATGNTVYLTGKLGGTVSFGGTTLAGPTQSALFVARLTDTGSAGSYVWALPIYINYIANPNVLALSGKSLYLAGMVAGPVSFGGISLPANGPVAFLAALADETFLTSARPKALQGVSLLPNPASSTANVLLPRVQGVALATLTVLNNLGQVARSQRAPMGAACTLDLAGLAPGTYMVRVQAGEAQTTQRLLVME